MGKLPNITKADNMRRRHTTLTQLQLMAFTPETTQKRRRRLMARSMERNNILVSAVGRRHPRGSSDRCPGSPSRGFLSPKLYRLRLLTPDSEFARTAATPMKGCRLRGRDRCC